MSCNTSTLVMTHESTPSEDSGMDIPQLVDQAEDLVRVSVSDGRKANAVPGGRGRTGAGVKPRKQQARPYTPSEPEEEITDYWDQEKYLTEYVCDDEPIDEDTTLRLLNFGDDYRNYIDSNSEDGDLDDDDFVLDHDDDDEAGLAGGLNRTLVIDGQDRDLCSPWLLSSPSPASSLLSSDAFQLADISLRSHSEVVHRLANVKAMLAHQQARDALVDLVTACEENVSLMSSLIRLGDACGAAHDTARVALSQWESTLFVVKEYLDVLDVNAKLRTDLDLLRERLDAVADDILVGGEEQLKSALVTLGSYKSSLFGINLGVHKVLASLRAAEAAEADSCVMTSSTTSAGSDSAASLVEADASVASRKQVVALYARWEQLFQRASSRLLELDALKCEWSSETAVLQTAMRNRRNKDKRPLSFIEDSGLSSSSSSTGDDRDSVELGIAEEQPDATTETTTTTTATSTTKKNNNSKPKRNDSSASHTNNTQVPTQTPKEARLRSQSECRPKPQHEEKTAKSNNARCSVPVSSVRRALRVAFAFSSVLLAAAAAVAFVATPRCCDNAYYGFTTFAYLSREGSLPPI